MDRELERMLPASTATAWRHMAGILPRYAYLAGGTGITAHLHHRLSKDLDFFSTSAFDLDTILAAMEAVGTTAVTQRTDDTLKVLFNDTPVELLSTAHVPLLRPTSTISGIEVADLDDIQAMKLRAITGRGELRDYFDLMAIEQTGRLTETGIALFVDKFCRGSTDTSAAVLSVVMALGFLGDVDDDPALPVARVEIEKYWHRRQPAIIRHLDRYGHTAPMPDERPRPT